MNTITERLESMLRSLKLPPQHEVARPTEDDIYDLLAAAKDRIDYLESIEEGQDENNEAADELEDLRSEADRIVSMAKDLRDDIHNIKCDLSITNSLDEIGDILDLLMIAENDCEKIIDKLEDL